MLREEDRAVTLESPQSLNQKGCRAGSGSCQLVNDPKHAVDAKPPLGCDLAEEGVARQQDSPVHECGNQTEAVVRRQGTVTPLDYEGLLDLVRCQIVGDQAVVLEVLPLLLREVEDFRRAYGQRNHESVRQIAEGLKQSTLAEVDQAGSVIDNDTGHCIGGPLICCSTASRGSLRRAAARTGEISSSPMARQTSRSKRWGFSNAPNP